MGQENSGGGTVGKALRVLEDVAAHDRPVRFTELLQKSDMPKATLYRLLQTLIHQGMLQYDPDLRSYSLGVRLVRLAHVAWRHSSLAPIARPYLDELAQEIGETLHLAQLDNGHVLYVDKMNAAEPVEMFAQAGRVGPAYCTGVGKAILAFLSPQDLDSALNIQSFQRHTPNTLCCRDALESDLARIRKHGHALDREEHEPGIICVAAPIVTSLGRVLGAVSATSTTQRHSCADLEDLAPILKDCAHRIATVAEAWRFPDAPTHTMPSLARSLT